jgi:tRNA nucleotidyltransferase/poly(A) polymerase
VFSGTSWRDALIVRFPALARLGDDAYVVGGAIRDLSMGLDPADVDVACLDPLAAARRVRPRVIRLGDQEHLSAYRVVDDEHVYDFAEILDHDLDADLARRDFTIDAMAVHLASGAFLDPHDGHGDVGRRVLRMIRPENFDDDPLRVLKGVRLAVKYALSVDPATLEAMRTFAPRIVEMAAERVTYELSLILPSTELLFETGLADALGFKSAGQATSLAGAYALLLEDPRAFAARWKWSATLLRDVLTLQRLFERHDRIALYDAGETLAREAQSILGEKLDMPDFTIRPLLTGDEIAALARVEPGKELGRIKRALLEAQIRGEVKTREDAIASVRRSLPPS